MNKLEKLEKKYEELGKEIEKLKNEDSFVAGYYMYWDDEDVPNEKHIYYIDSKSQYDGIYRNWPNVKPVTPKLMEQFYQKPDTIYDWSKIPKVYNWAVTNEDGTVHFSSCIFSPTPTSDGTWQHQYEKIAKVNMNVYLPFWKECDDKTIVLNSPNNWKESLERRPE